MIRRSIAGIEGLVERSVFGTADPGAIVEAMDAFCIRHLGAAIDRYIFYRSSIASVHGVALADGRRVVVKARQPGIDRPHLEAMAGVQRHLAVDGFPCPEPLLGPTPLVRGLATVERELAVAEPRDGHEPAFRNALARCLAELIERCRSLGAPVALPLDRGLRVPDGRLWPTPHARIFDFEATTRGAERIDAVAAIARRVIDRVPVDEPILGHTDWRAENVRFDGERIVAVFDWESLLRTVEPVLVGAVAHAFPSDWNDPPPGSQTPSVEEVRAFVSEYEDASGRPLEDRRAIGAGYAYATAYTARCEHALDPERVSEQGQGFRTVIDEHGAELLDLFLEG